MRRLAWMLLIVGLVSFASAARAPKDSQDLVRCLDAWWGKSAADFPKAAGLKTGEFAADPSTGGATRKLKVTEAGRARWTPKSLAAAAQTFEFDPKLGLIEVSGALKGTAADFDTLLKELNSRYGQYSTHTSALEAHTYGWVFPKATLSVTSNEGVPAQFRIQANP
jgi:hypothetical protein